jgi:hypothetical protein
MIFARLYTIIFSARVQEIHSLQADVKKLVENCKVSRVRDLKVSRQEKRGRAPACQELLCEKFWLKNTTGENKESKVRIPFS